MNVADFYALFLRCGKVTIDSRTIEKGDLFFAFSGDNFNAATLAEAAMDQGALAVVVEQEAFENRERNIFYVRSTLAFLQELARYHRERIGIPVIGLTGSNGKTTTKELISAVLSKKYNVQYTKGNLNNHIGVPLTLLSIRSEHTMAVVEMGANHQGEIAFLCEIARPDYGYITNFGKAHLEGFGGFEGVIKGKSELYDYLKANGKTIVYNTSDALQVGKVEGYAPTVSFGVRDSDYCFERLSKDQFVGIRLSEHSVVTNLTGEYNFTNLCAAAALGLHFGVEEEAVASALAEYMPTNMRSQVMEKNGKILVLDTYNANPSSMTVSLENFSEFNGSKTVIMGDMLELGEASGEEHRSLLALAESLGFERIITVGKHFQAVHSGEAFTGTDELKAHLSEHPITTDNVLLKGSRGVALERMVEVI